MNPFLHPSLEDAYRASPVVLVDVGASGGLSPVWVPAAENLRVIAFDPDPRAAEASPPGWLCLERALARRGGSAKLFLTRKAQCSSMFEPNREFLDAFPDQDRFDVVRTVEVEVDTLDHQLEAAGVSDVDFIKLDAQGSELDILMGGHQALSTAVGVEVEVEFAEIYRKQPLFGDIDLCLRAAGLELMELNPCYWKRSGGASLGDGKGQLVFADAVYVRKVAAFADGLAPLERSVARDKLLHALTTCAVYGYLDYAMDLCATAGTCLDPEELEVIQREISREVTRSNRLPLFRGRGRLAGLFLGLHERLKPPSWADYSAMRPRS